MSIRQFRHKEGKKFEEKQETGSKEYPRLGFNKNFSEKAEKIYVWLELKFARFYFTNNFSYFKWILQIIFWLISTSNEESFK